MVTKYHILKALQDIELVPDFSNDERTELKSSIAGKLALVLDDASEDDFKSFVSGTSDKPKTINIADINGFVLFNASSYEKVLGDNQEARRNYYAYSNKSNIANIISLLDEKNYTEQNDAINEYVARGLGKLGLVDDAIKHVNDTVLIPNNRFTSFNWLGDDFSDYGDNTSSLKALDKAFEQFKANKKGKEASTTSTDTINLLGSAERYEKINNIQKADEVVDYLLELMKSVTSAYDYQSIVYNIERKGLSSYSKNNDLVRAKTYAKKAAEESLNIPLIFYGMNLPSFAIDGQYQSAITAKFFQEETASANAIKKARELEAGASNPTYGISNKEFVYASFESNDIDGRITEFDKLSARDKKTVLENGFAAILVKNGKIEKLFEYYNDKTIFTREDFVADQIDVISATKVSTNMGIKLLNTEDTFKAYLKKMKDLIESWTITDDEYARGSYANWDDSYKTGYLALAYEYNKLGDSTTAKEIVENAIKKVLALTDGQQVREGVSSIFMASEEMGIDISKDKETMLDSLKAAALLGNKKESIAGMISSANLLSANNKKADAIEVLDKALTLVPELDKNSQDYPKDVENNIEYLIGEGSYSSFEDSLAYAYFLASNRDGQKDEKNKAIELVNTAQTNAATIDTSSTQYIALLKNIVVAYASLNDIEKAKTYLAKITTAKEREEAGIAAAAGLYQFDAFESKVASIDSDKDGKPDFFNPSSSEDDIKASQLELDDDIDGDGKADDVDELPYDNI